MLVRYLPRKMTPYGTYATRENTRLPLHSHVSKSSASELGSRAATNLSPHASQSSSLEVSNYVSPHAPSSEPSSLSSSSVSASASPLPPSGNLPAPANPNNHERIPRLINPFDSHKFFQSLEKEFPAPIAHTLMRATRGLLIHRIAQAKRDGLDVMESENQQYLYRAALSELRTELSMRTKNESAALQTSTSVIRKDVESLSARMKEELATLKHNVQMDMNNRKNEVNSDTKKSAIAIEELHHKATVMISDLRTDVEQAKWDNTRRGVAIIGLFVMFVIASLELAPKPASKPKPLKPISPPAPASELSLSSPPTRLSSSTTQAGSHGRVNPGESSRAESHLRDFSESSQV